MSALSLSNSALSKVYVVIAFWTVPEPSVKNAFASSGGAKLALPMLFDK